MVDFYSTEDFLQVLGVFPFAIHVILAGVEWSTACENTMTVWNAMRISFDITEKEEELNGQGGGALGAGSDKVSENESPSRLSQARGIE